MAEVSWQITVVICSRRLKFGGSAESGAFRLMKAKRPTTQLTPHDCQAFSLPDSRWTAVFPALSSFCWSYS